MRIDEFGEENREHLERIRGELLHIVAARSDQETNALNRMVTYMGLICSGATIAILGFIGQQVKTGIPIFAIGALACFACALLTFALFLYLQFQLHSARWSLSANMAELFFTRQAHIEDVMEANGMLTSRWTYRRLFWIPFMLLCAGFVLSLFALTGFGPVTLSMEQSRQAPSSEQPKKSAIPSIRQAGAEAARHSGQDARR